MPDIFGNPTSVELNEQFRQESSDDAFRRAQRRIQTIEERLEQQGVEPPAEAGPGALESVLDFITTPAQFVAGGVAKVAGVRGFRDKSLFDAAIKGTEEDLTVGEILRKEGVLKDAPVLRGVAGFVGDVLLDPLTYLTAGVGAGVKVAGKTLADDAVRLGKDAAKKLNKEFATPDEIRLLGQREALEKRVGTAKEQLEKGLIDDDRFKFLEETAKVDAAGDAARPFREARAAIKRRRELEAKGFSGKTELDLLREAGDEGVTAADAAILDITKQEKRVRDALGLAEDIPLEQLFKKRAIRGLGLLPGVGQKYGHLPGFIQSPGFDIPGITAGTEKLFDVLSGPLYNASVGVGRAMTKTIRKLEKSDIGPLVFSAQVMRAARKFPALVSKRAQAGSSEAFELLQEDEVARAALIHEVGLESDHMFRNWFKLGGTKEQLDEFGRVMEAGIRPHFLKSVKNVPNDQQVFRNAVERARQTFNQQAPGLGDEGARLALQVEDDFARYAVEGETGGFLRATREGYFTHLTKHPEEMTVEAKEGVVRGALGRIQRSNPNFSLARTFATNDQKFIVSGILPNYNLQDVWFHRTLQQRRALHEKDFLERLGYEIALPRKTYAAMKAAVASKNEQVSKTALEFLRRRDIDPTEALQSAIVGQRTGARKEFLAAKGKKHSEPLTKKSLNGEYLSVEGYQNIKRLAQSTEDGVEFRAAREMADALGLKFTQKELDDVIGLDGLQTQYREGLLGRAGELFTTRAGAELPNQKFRSMVSGSKALTKEEKNFFNGLVPTSFAQAFNESLDTRGTLTRLAGQLSKDGKSSDMAEALENSASVYLGWVKNLKLGATIWWPAFHMRNFGSAQLQSVKSASVLGEAFQPMRLVETFRARRHKKGIVDNFGRHISAEQLEREAARFGFLNESAAAMVDVQNHINDHLGAMMGKSLRDPKHSKGFFERTMKATRPQGAQLDLAEKAGVANFANFIENFGREHLYFQLRKQGADPASAASEVRRIMIDYARGKTRFERDLLNNVFFFYSFARAETANTLTAMVTRPGALTAQVHAVEGIKEMLMDPDAIPLPEGSEERLKTLRGQETISRFIGQTEEGFPKFIQGFGVPIEEVGKFINLRAPKDMTMQSVIDAGAHNTRRTLTNVLGNLNPVLKTPLEVVTNHSFYFDRPLSDESLRKVAKFEEDYEKILPHPFDAIPEAVFKSLNATTQTMLKARDNGDGTMTADWKRLAWLSQVVPGAGRFLSTSRAITNKKLDTGERVVRALTGVRPVEVDPQKSEAFSRLRQLEEFEVDEVLARSNKQLTRLEAMREALERETFGKNKK